MKFFDFFKFSTKPTRDIGIDLGTTNTIVYPPSAAAKPLFVLFPFTNHRQIF